VWMRLTPGTASDAPRCCGTDAAGEDARRAAAHLGIPFYALDYAEIFGREVVDRFVRSYASGETPNPCVACNGYVKFEALLGDVKRKFGASRLATGHYARVATTVSGRRALLRARDAQKDQSYALYMLGQAELAALELPIGELHDKAETRALAARYGLPNAAKAESMDICFIGGDYRDFVRGRAPEAFVPGPIERADGTVSGAHARGQVGDRERAGIRRGCGWEESPAPGWLARWTDRHGGPDNLPALKEALHACSSPCKSCCPAACTSSANTFAAAPSGTSAPAT